ncbi:hypothetical protein [Solirubrum puertoriconensis]|uniref:Uncharacterized protein n=1 Tax=Solirubrum puertoriconensis TaxID=1751427 RepID=A0A9X0L3W9_SOLP1|nr:hypothetical protein [Solirubrum puertoriconensis]KUG06983.1 hypothetical protein ASU33_06590 [Solirubrum puertoriconensis]
MPLLYPLVQRLPLLGSLMLTLLLGACDSVMPGAESEEPTHYTLSQQEQAWTTPYRLGEEWRFVNQAGYERRYQVKGLSDKDQPGMASKGARVQYYQQEVGTRLERVDSAYYERADAARFAASFTLGAAAGQQPLEAALQWGNLQLPLPVAELENQQTLPAGVRLLPSLTAGGRIFNNVLEYPTLQPAANQAAAAWQVQRVYYTKEYGVVRFVEAGGTVWDRL